MEAGADKGMTLIEVLVALLILFVTTVVVVQALSVILRLETQSRYMSEAIPQISTLSHDCAAGLDAGKPSLEVPGWILERQNEEEEDRERLYDLYPEARRTFRIPLVL